MDPEEERILLKRESERYEKGIKNQLVRNLKYMMKVKGFNKIQNKESKILKVFLGYAMSINLFSSLEFMNALVTSIKNDVFVKKIQQILINKYKNPDKIIEILSSGRNTGEISIF